MFFRVFLNSVALIGCQAACDVAIEELCVFLFLIKSLVSIAMSLALTGLFCDS